MTGSNSSCFDRWLNNNPGKTYEQFLKALAEFKKGKDFSPPKVTMLPGGTIVSAAGLSPAEISNINAEYSKAAATNQ